MTTKRSPKRANQPSDSLARQEAGPFDPESLGDDQRDALRGALRVFGSLRRNAPPVPSEASERGRHSYLPEIDEKRLNAVVTIDGRRGVGKTSVLLTALKILSQRVRRELDESSLKSLRLEATSFDGIVPVGLVDVEALEPGTDLTLRLCSCFLAVVEALEQGDEQTRPTSAGVWGATPDHELSSRKAWRGLLETVVARQAGVAAADFAVKVIEAEHAAVERRNGAERFREFIDALSRDYKDAFKVDPLFVIAIDDPDLNAEMVQEVSLWPRIWFHPRVAYLVAADVSLVRERIRDRMVRDIASVHVHTDASPRLANRVVRYETLADQITEKAFPPAQTYSVLPLTLVERASRVAGMKHSARNGEGSLRALRALDALPLLANALPSSRRDFSNLAAQAARDETDLVSRVVAGRQEPMGLGQLFRSEPGRLVAPQLHVCRYPAAEDRGAVEAEGAARFVIAQIHTNPDVPWQLDQQSMSLGPVSSGVAIPGRPWHWPLPPWPSFFHHAAFVTGWMARVDALIGPNHVLDTFLGLIVAIFECSTSEEVLSKNWSRVSLPSRLEALRLLDPGVLQELAPLTPELADWWRRTGLLILAPEAGLPAQLANEAFARSGLASALPGKASRLHDNRRALLRRLLPDASDERGLDRLETNVNQRFLDFSFVRRVTGRSVDVLGTVWGTLVKATHKYRVGDSPWARLSWYAAEIDPELTHGWSQSEQECVAEALAQMAQTEGDGREVIHRIWRALCRENAVPVSLHALVRLEEVDLAADLPFSRSAAVEEEAVVREGTLSGVLWRLSKVTLPEPHFPSELASPAARAILWLAAAFAQDNRTGEGDTLVAWPGLNLLRDDVTARWVAPHWPGIVDQRWLARAWNDHVDRLAPDGEPAENQRFLDALGAWWLRANIVRGGAPDQEPNLDFSLPEWNLGMFSMPAIPRRRSRAALDFWTAALGFAAPEYGWSYALSERWLERGQGGADVLAPPAARARLAKEQRLPADLPKLLRKRFPDHPWNRRFP